MSIRAHMGAPLADSERRNGDRLHLYLATSGTLPEGSQANVEIHNISAGGMLLETSLPLHKGARLTVDLPENGHTIASVVWAGEGVYGCAFEQPISAASLGAVQLKADSPLPPRIGADRVSKDVNVTLGKKLEQIRKGRGLTLAQVADQLGVSKPTVWAWEKGKARPLDERFPAIADALGVDADELMLPDHSASWAAIVEESRHQIAEAIGVDADQIRIMIDL